MRTGLFGGTFNPVHIGHLRAALEIKEAFDLDGIILIPSFVPPHKKLRGVADSADRLAMLEQAICGHPDFMISDAEIQRRGTSYTIDTIRYFKSISPPDTEFYFIVGTDAFLEIDTWKSYIELLQEIPFVVMVRAGGASDRCAPLWKRLEDYLRLRVSAAYTYSDADRCFLHPRLQPVCLFETTPLDISSTRIRSLIRSGRTIEFLVPERVDAYIKTKGLFL